MTVFYDCDDSCERLSHETPEEAILGYLERRGDLEDLKDLATLAKEHAPLRVYEYRQRSVSESWMKSAAKTLVDNLAEMFNEEFGNPEDTYDECISDEAAEDAAHHMVPWMTTTLASAHVWLHDQVEHKDYSAEELETVLRENT